MKKIFVVAAALALSGPVAVQASTVGASNGNGKAFAWGKSKTKKVKTSKKDCNFFRGGCSNAPKPGGGNNSDVGTAPIPAAGFLLLAGIGALAFTKRRKS